MQTLVVYDSKFGNTEQIAHAIADGLRTNYNVQIASLADAPLLSAAELDLLVVGGPTQKHGASPELSALLSGLSRRSLAGLQAAAFDTRYHISAFLSGSAAQRIADRLKRAGCQLVAAPASFFVERDQPPAGAKRRHAQERLEAGEVERAKAWAQTLGQRGPLPGEEPNRATSINAKTIGVIFGLSGITHGLAEILQGNTPTHGVLINAIAAGSSWTRWAEGSEGAFTLVPNFLLTGTLAVLLGFPYNLVPGLRKLPVSDMRDWEAIRAWADSLATTF
ncbi:MAG: flavodoxin domain-containing protein [Caldilineaceae bacterium]